MNFEAQHGELIISEVDGRLHWRGQPEQHPVDWAAAIPGTSDGIVLYHYYRPDHPYGSFENLVRVKPDASIVWRAELPESSDKYVAARPSNGSLFARSWSGYEVEIDLGTGRIKSKIFIK